MFENERSEIGRTSARDVSSAEGGLSSIRKAVGSNPSTAKKVLTRKKMDLFKF